MVSDLAKLAPKSVKTLFENEKVRVSIITLKKGQKLPEHSHTPNFLYALTSGRWKSTAPDGKTELVKMKKGDGGWSDGSIHPVEGLAPTNILQIELK